MGVTKILLCSGVVVLTALILAKVLESGSKSFRQSFIIDNASPEEVFKFFLDQKKFVKVLPFKLTISDYKRSTSEAGLHKVSYLGTTQPTRLFGFYEKSFTYPITATELANTEQAALKTVKINVYVWGFMNEDEEWSVTENPKGGTLVTEHTTITTFKFVVDMLTSEIQEMHTGFMQKKLKSVFERGDHKKEYSYP